MAEDASSARMQADDRALASSCRIKQLFSRQKRPTQATLPWEPVPRTSADRLKASLDGPLDRASLDTEKKRSVLYLAYGSNLCNETFRGVRGIKPISQINVQIPSLRLTFDLPGIPYGEPCFANTGRRDPANDPPSTRSSESNCEKGQLLPGTDDIDYHKNRWHKGLIGVVYEVTAEDYAHIIATEGGGSSYHDILVDCHPFESDDPAIAVPQNPTTPAFKAHTLFAPATIPGEQPPEGGRFQRPDINYAQASARYLKLITDGATELQLPNEYQDYLHQLRPYTITNNRQQMGQFVFLSLWLPFISLVFALGRAFNDHKGRAPPWLKQLSGAIFAGCWASYDQIFEPLFGDGERSIPDGGKGSEDGGDDEVASRNSRWLPTSRREEVCVEKGLVDDRDMER